MPSIDENLAAWNVGYAWHDGGEEWSERWGGSEVQWQSSIYPRIQHMLPVETILEIGPGYGRWTQYLRDHCERIILVDVSKRCIDACQARFGESATMAYLVNDGRSLEMLQSQSVDFVFSFDSLVHCEVDVIAAYLGELNRVLKPSGSGFIHHSNLGSYRRTYDLVQKLPDWIQKRLHEHEIVNLMSWRARSMTAARFARLADAAGLHCVQQELVNWHSRMLIDCLSTINARRCHPTVPLRVIRNFGFMREADDARRLRLS